MTHIKLKQTLNNKQFKLPYRESFFPSSCYLPSRQARWTPLGSASRSNEHLRPLSVVPSDQPSALVSLTIYTSATREKSESWTTKWIKSWMRSEVDLVVVIINMPGKISGGCHVPRPVPRDTLATSPDNELLVVLVLAPCTTWAQINARRSICKNLKYGMQGFLKFLGSAMHSNLQCNFNFIIINKPLRKLNKVSTSCSFRSRYHFIGF